MLKFDHVGGCVDDDEYDVYGDGNDDKGMITKIAIMMVMMTMMNYVISHHNLSHLITYLL
jgi:hypothetical protein